MEGGEVAATGVFEQQAHVAPVIGLPHSRGLHTDFGGDTRQHQVSDAARLKQGVSSVA